MNKRLFYLLVTLMSVSLIGIVFVQGYWIKNTVEVNEQQFSLKANQILLDVSNRLELRELEIYYFAFKKVADSIGSAQDVSFGEFFKIQQDDFTNETFIYSNGLLEEDYKISSSFLNSNVDSLKFKKLVKQQAERIIKEKSAQKSPKISDVASATISEPLSSLTRASCTQSSTPSFVVATLPPIKHLL